MAGQWKRLNIETVEDAMRYTEKEHKKLNNFIKQKDSKEEKVKNNVKRAEKLPAWFNKEQDVHETSSEEKEEMDAILKELI